VQSTTAIAFEYFFVNGDEESGVQAEFLLSFEQI
jgi:hypothetical protein